MWVLGNVLRGGELLFHVAMMLGVSACHERITLITGILGVGVEYHIDSNGLGVTHISWKLLV